MLESSVKRRKKKLFLELIKKKKLFLETGVDYFGQPMVAFAYVYNGSIFGFNLYGG